MDFCKECGSRLEPKKIKSGKQTMLVLASISAEKKQTSQMKPKSTAKS